MSNGHESELAEEIADLQRELVIVRQNAIRWEREAKHLRDELHRLRQDRPTDRIDLEPHDISEHA